MEKEIFEKCLKMYMPVHNFKNGTRAVFYKGFKFEEVTDRNGNTTYNCYNIRYMSYKKLTDDELWMVMDKGILVAADVLSYQSYKTIMTKYSSAITNPNNGYKAIEKAKRVVEHYDKICNGLKHLHKKHSELFV
jgi:hypothetical protein